ncbi:MAG: 50S ribosomal protein L3 [Halobacteriovoraceae bacterium]|nr:50S ribosomal protein L3 [Halobacteriovoraceae bacterium]
MSENAKVDLSAFYAKKAGMTRIFDEQGNHIPVTVIELIPNFISQVKTSEKEGYTAYQVTYGNKREKLVNKPTKGILAKAKIDSNTTKFFEVKSSEVSEENLGRELDLSAFESGSYVDITGITKGKGFQGTIKRFNFAGGPGSHGSHFHRSPGSIGNRATPARVFKLKKMPGHMGSIKQTTQNLKIVEVNTDQGYMLVKGSVPGSKNSFVKISKALKK